MARYNCSRCGIESNTLDEPHLCKDLKKRYERNKKAIEIVERALIFYHLDEYVDTEEVAVAIVKELSGRDLGDN